MSRRVLYLALTLLVAVGVMPAQASEGYVYIGPDSSGRYRPTVDTGGNLTVLANVDSITPPALSPDGARLAFAGVVGDGSLGKYAIFLVNANGTGLTQLTTGVEGEFDPSWSPDGGTLVISQNQNASILSSNCCRVALVNVGNGQITGLTQNTGAVRPEFSPDGDLIVYDTPGGVWQIASGGGPSTLIAAGGFDATVSPNSENVAYLFRNGVTTEIRVASISGGPSTVVYSTANQLESPSWSAGRIQFLEYAGLGYDGRKSPMLRSITASGGGLLTHRTFSNRVVGVSEGGDNDEIFFYRDDGLFRYYDIRVNATLPSPILGGSAYTTGWSSIASVDLDGDGLDEMFFYRSDGLFRYYNIQSNGALPAPMQAGAGYTTGWDTITSLDLDGDGQDEMFFYRSDGLFRYYHVKSDGGLPAPLLAGSDYTNGWDVITSVDLDGDGQDEMFFYREDGLYRFYDIQADATLGPAISQGSNFEENLTNVSAIDLDGDGVDEMLLYKANGEYVYHDVEYPGDLQGVIAEGSNYTGGWSIITSINLRPG